MRILHISEAFGGGLRTAIANYVSATPQFDHTIYGRARPGWQTFDIPQGTPCEFYSGGLPGFYASARRTVVRNDFDIVHLHSSFAGLLRVMLPRSTRIVYSPHCYAMEAGHSALRRRAYWAAERLLARRPQLLLAVSPREIEIGKRLNPAMLSHEVPNAASPAAAPLTGRADPTQRPTIAMVGRICDQKDPNFFADVAAAGRGRYHYLWIGDGESGRERLERAGVEITGWVSPSRARELLSSAALYVHSAAWEGGPIATLEAADAGCPVLCRSIPSMTSLGYHAAGDSPEMVALAVDRFFSDPNYHDQVRWQTIAVLTACSFERMSAELTEAYMAAAERLGGTAQRLGR